MIILCGRIDFFAILLKPNVYVCKTYCLSLYIVIFLQVSTLIMGRLIRRPCSFQGVDDCLDVPLLPWSRWLFQWLVPFQPYHLISMLFPLQENNSVIDSFRHGRWSLSCRSWLFSLIFRGHPKRWKYLYRTETFLLFVDKSAPICYNKL